MRRGNRRTGSRSPLREEGLRLTGGLRKERGQHLIDLRALALRARGTGVAVIAKGLGVLKVVAAAAAVVLINRHRAPQGQSERPGAVIATAATSAPEVNVGAAARSVQGRRGR
jgi:hypothetical protein